MPLTQEPVIVIVHGAWHRPLHYATLARPMRAEGYTVVLPANVTAGWDTVPGKTHFDDVEVIRASVAPYLDAGQEIVLVCHSYGAIPGTEFIKGNTVAERKAAGLKGGIKSVVYICAFALPQQGMSLFKAVGERKPGWWDIEDDFAVLNGESTERLYGDIDKPEIEMCTSSLVRQSFASFKSPVSHTATEVHVPKTYVACKEDRVLPYEIQIDLAAAIGADLVELPCGHSPFLKEAETTKLLSIIKAAGSRGL